MDAVAELKRLKTQLLDQISSAASARDFPRVARLSGLASECEALEVETTSLRKRVEALAVAIDGFAGPQEIPQEFKPSVDLWKALSPKAAGGEARRNWVAHLESIGVSLTGHGKRYQSPQGTTVGVAFANELPDLENRWWLGLRDEPTDVAVFLCHSVSREVHDIVVPVQDVVSAWRALSRHRDQIKFNIKKDGTRFLLLVPGGQPIDITRYVGNYDPLRSVAA